MTDIFVAGTDTGVGKTIVAACLAQAWSYDYWKPLQTGLAAEPGDSATVARLSGAPAHPCAYEFQAPLSPAAAAALEGRQIDFEGITRPRGAVPLIIEGAGGLLVPIDDRHMMLDLIQMLGCPALLVARSTLGTINHTLLSLAALRERGIPILGVILNGPPNPGNRRAIEEHGHVRIIAEFPVLPVIDAAAVEELSARIPARAELLPAIGGDRRLSPAEITEIDRRHLWHPFTQAATAPDAIPIRSAYGAWLTGTDGTRYLDLISSWWVTLHGHAHPAIAAAIARQARELEQVIFAGFTHEPAVRLAARLVPLLPAGLSRVFYSDNGSTSVEIALKLAYQYWRNRGEARRRRFLAFEGGYHGDTFGAMAAGYGSGFYEIFRDLIFDVDLLPFPFTWTDDRDIERKEQAALAALDRQIEDHGDEIAALIIEPLVQGASGMRMCRPEFLFALRQRLTAAGILMICDEVMTGFGRTGALFACGKAGIAPDLICLSKGLSGGFLPLSATICTEAIFSEFLGANFDKAFAHGHSFTANPLGCAAALASLDLLETSETRRRIAGIEAVHRARLPLLAERAEFAQTRCTGTIAAVTFAGADKRYGTAFSRKLQSFFLDRGILLRPTGPEIYMLPPYCTSEDELHRGYDAIEAVAELMRKDAL